VGSAGPEALPLLHGRCKMTSTQRTVRNLTVAALVFQGVHFVEHTAQLIYWLFHPTQMPWMTPWAIAGRDLLAVDGTPRGGTEILHLLGNVIFFGGLIGMVLIAGYAGYKMKRVPYLREAVILQGFHVAENVLLTVSYLTWGTVIGVTTVFGAASGVFESSLRVWSHFLLNLVATYYAVRAIRAMYRKGLFSFTPTTATRELASR